MVLLSYELLKYIQLEAELLELTLPNLKRKCTEESLTPTGTKAILTERLLAKLLPLSEADKLLLADVQLRLEDGKGFVAPPVVRGIAIFDIIIDLLHMKLRIGGKLLKLLLTRDVLKDQRQDLVVQEDPDIP